MLRKSFHAEALARAMSEMLEEEEKRTSRKKKRYNSRFTDGYNRGAEISDEEDVVRELL